MTTISAEFEIVTPLFLGGAFSDELADSIRPPSIKGALRFWWRALWWAKLRAQYTCMEAALIGLHAEEARLFGNAAKDKQGGQGVFMLNVQFNNAQQPIKNYPPESAAGSRYLGLGLFEMGEHKQRPAFVENLHFKLNIRFHPKAQESDMASIQKAVEAFGLLGGLGARGQRRGFGSISLKTLNGANSLPQDLNQYKTKIKTLLETTGDLPETAPFSALHRQSSIALLSEKKTACDTHNAIGHAFQSFRGQDGPYRGEQKIPLGLPLQGISEKRRASPLGFHVHKLQTGFAGIAILYEAKFHPDYPDIEFTIIKDWLADKEAINP